MPRVKKVVEDHKRTDQAREATEEFLPGMYVRIPRDIGETPLPGEHRDFCIGQLAELELATASAQIQILEPYDDHRMRPIKQNCPLAFVRRCALAPNARFLHKETRKWGRILIACEQEFILGKLRRYYVELGDEIRVLSEDEVFATLNEQSPDPKQQLLDYEFHPPAWKIHRDNLVEGYAALQSATFGIEELVGARIMLLAHQAEVVSHVLGDRICRYMLADEVGLGKTIQTCVILKGLRRRHPRLKTLVIVPNALLRQWHNEINNKFWLDFLVLKEIPSTPIDDNSPGVIVSYEILDAQDRIKDWLVDQQWDLLIVDEAHNLRRNPSLYEYVHGLSKQTARALVLSATPVQRRAEEYLALLKLMYPAQYDKIQMPDFERMLTTQGTIRNTVAYLAKALTPKDFDASEFQTEIASVVETLSHDQILAKLASKVRAKSRERSLEAAQETIQYISENYRIENRVIRNRRSNLSITLAIRQVSLEFSYTSTDQESETLLALHKYAAACLATNHEQIQAIEHCRELFQALFSSPAALLALLLVRQDAVGKQKELGPVKAFTEEPELLERLIWRVQRWEEETSTALRNLPQQSLPPNLPHRLVQVMRAIHQAWREPHFKVLIFSAWAPTLEVLRNRLNLTYGKQAVAWFKTGLDPEQLQSEVDRFQSDDACRILLTDESGGEGRNFQIADQIIHVDLPWTPTQIEQRIGRVDRLGRIGTVLSIVPFAKSTLEEDLFNIWHQAFRLFEQSMSGMEIVLGEIQDQIIIALTQSTQTGLASLLPQMKRTAEKLRTEVEEERYFEEGAINYRRRAEFADISDKYRDGERLRGALLNWADMAGLRHDYDPSTKIALFEPRRFNFASIHNAKFIRPPDMKEALRRSGRQHNLVLKGTFNRDLAIRREDIIFLAPGEIWSDSILINALEADRGRCSAILRSVPGLSEDWHGLELFYRLSVDPRPLYAAGFHPTNLFRAQGYLEMPTYRLYVSVNGDVIKPSSQIATMLRPPFSKNRDVPLGERGVAKPPIHEFKRLYPQENWHALINKVLHSAEEKIQQELDFMAELAEEAKATYARNASGQRAAYRWLYGTEDTSRAKEISEYEAISQSLVAGIAQPIWQLESACFWILKAGIGNGNRSN